MLLCHLVIAIVDLISGHRANEDSTILRLGGSLESQVKDFAQSCLTNSRLLAGDIKVCTLIKIRNGLVISSFLGRVGMCGSTSPYLYMCTIQDDEVCAGTLSRLPCLGRPS